MWNVFACRPAKWEQIVSCIFCRWVTITVQQEVMFWKCCQNTPEMRRRFHPATHLMQPRPHMFFCFNVNFRRIISMTTNVLTAVSLSTLLFCLGQQWEFLKLFYFLSVMLSTDRVTSLSVVHKHRTMMTWPENWVLIKLPSCAWRKAQHFLRHVLSHLCIRCNFKALLWFQ